MSSSDNVIPEQIETSEMKQIKTFLTVTLFLTAFLANAQIKVHNDNQISIGSLTKQYGIQYYPEGFTLFERNTNPDYSWITITQTTNIRSKCWVVRNPNYEVINPFYVSGGGIVYRVGEYDLADSRYQNEIGDIENPSDIVNGLSAFYYSFSNEIEAGNNRDLKRRVGFSAQDIEKVLPEAVESDENGVLYLDYEAITAVLVEALKEQQQEIENLRSVLKENGLLK